MNLFAGKHILVVGGSGAFGQEFCNQLIAEGALVSGTARTSDSSVNLRADLASRLILDLESPQSIEAVAAYVAGQSVPLDGIVLASGLVAFGSILETPQSVLDRLMTVNFSGQVELVRALLPKLQESASSGRSPFVVSLSGVISETPLPNLAAYSASKTAIHGYSLAAAREFSRMGITWLDARPGHTESGLAGRAIFGVAPNFGTGKMTSDVVARIVRGIIDGEPDLPSKAF
jgi:cyclic-di-GMP-binding biofilm dispersal mediator protein